MTLRESNLHFNDCKFFGYKHWTTEIHPRCFYVGKGLSRRPYQLKCRSNKHRNVVAKHGCRIEICVGPLRHDEIIKWEISEISKERTHHYYDPDGIGCNFTLGGEGTPGSHCNLGKKKPPFSDSHREALRLARSRQNMTKHSLAMIGKNRRPRPDLVERNQARKGSMVRCSTCNELGHNCRSCRV